MTINFCRIKKNRNININESLICISALICLALILLYRAFFSFCQSDEAFYVSLAHRIFLGDKLFIDEWHPTQLYSLIIYPFYRIFRLFSNSSDGVYLYFRILQVIIAFSLSVFSYSVFKLYFSKLKALICAIFVIMFRGETLGISYGNLYFTFSAAVILILLLCKKKVLSHYI